MAVCGETNEAAGRSKDSKVYVFTGATVGDVVGDDVGVRDGDVVGARVGEIVVGLRLGEVVGV